jgi:O-antigen/teichoic acid export membrane protein
LGAEGSSARHRERIVLHNAVVSAGTIVAGLLGFAFQAAISHRVAPAQYGAIFAIISVMTVIGLPASALTLLMAREASRDRASGHRTPSAALLRDGNRILLVAGAGIAAGIGLSSPWLSRFLDVPIDLIIAAAAGVPFVLALPLLLGDLQGDERFGAFSILAAGQAILKLVCAVALGLLLGPVGIVLGISVASGLSYLLAHLLVKRKLAMRARWPWHRPALTFLSVLLPSTLSIAVLLSADVLLVKHFFAQAVAGQYAAVVALSRALYYAAAGVATVLFPKVVFRESQGASGARLVWLSLGLVVAGCLGGLAVLTLGSGLLLSAFAGAAYTSGAVYLPWYAVGMTALGAAAVLIAWHQSRGRYGFLAILVPLAVVEPVAIVIFHSSVLQVIQIVDACTLSLFLGLAALYLARRPRVAVHRSASFPSVNVVEPIKVVQ